MHVGGSVV